MNTDSKQMIIYGAPGTGKSYLIEKKLVNSKIEKEDMIRVVFHNDYSYSDFIGYITPYTTKENSQLEYHFIPGPFTLALEKAFNSNEQIYIIIEEINRGNSASIFGDIFQLLDRDKNGNSCYPITNRSIREYLNSKVDMEIFSNYRLGKNEVIIPSNLNIICTMNTADQNVFVIDSAFKRRFKMQYLPIDYSNRNDYLDLLDNTSKVNVFDNHHTWSEFAQRINQIIDDINYDGFSIPEDKKLGQYFVEEKDVSCKQAFCDKVIYYLKSDVFKYHDKLLNNSYEQIYEDFVIGGKDIFDII